MGFSMMSLFQGVVAWEVSLIELHTNMNERDTSEQIVLLNPDKAV